jgi:hypothetical protein
MHGHRFYDCNGNDFPPPADSCEAQAPPNTLGTCGFDFDPSSGTFIYPLIITGCASGYVAALAVKCQVLLPASKRLLRAHKWIAQSIVLYHTCIWLEGLRSEIANLMHLLPDVAADSPTVIGTQPTAVK